MTEMSSCSLPITITITQLMPPLLLNITFQSPVKHHRLLASCYHPLILPTTIKSRNNKLLRPTDGDCWR